MGNSSGNCPSNIKDQAERCGGFSLFSSPWILWSLPLWETSHKKWTKGKKERMGKRRKGPTKGEWKVYRCSIFSFERARVQLALAQTGSWYKVIHCLCCCFCFLPISFCFSVPMRLTLARLDLFTLTPKQKMRVFFFLILSVGITLCDTLRLINYLEISIGWR